jgi:hypothetical protein
MTDTIDRPWWEAYRQRLEKTFSQDDTDRHEAHSLKNAACPLEMMYVYSPSRSREIPWHTKGISALRLSLFADGLHALWDGWCGRAAARLGTSCEQEARVRPYLGRLHILLISCNPPDARAVLVAQHDGENPAGCLGVGRVFRPECHVRVVVVDLPKKTFHRRLRSCRNRAHHADRCLR